MGLTSLWALAGLALVLVARGFWRRLVVLLLALAAAGPTWQGGAGTTVVLLDQSPSAQAATQAAISELDLTGPVRYLAFAQEAQWVASPEVQRRDLGQTTDLAAALEEAMAVAPARLVLISDGIAAADFAPPPVPTYVHWVAPSPHVSLLALQAEANPTLGETAEVEAIIETNYPTSVELQFTGGEKPQTVSRDLPPGRFAIPYRFSLEGPTEVHVTMVAAEQKAEASVRVQPMGQLQAWVLGDPALAAYLRTQSFAVSEMKTLPRPIGADVVAIGAQAEDFSPAQLSSLERYLKEGGAVFFSATPSGLFFGNWHRSPIARFLPIEPRPQENPVALVLVLDVSGSMGEGSPTQLDLAVTGALELVRAARPEDYFGVVTFAGASRWLFKPKPMTTQAQREAESLLKSLRAGGGTQLRMAFAEAIQAVQATGAKDQQILVLTDGNVADSSQLLLQMAEQAGQAGIRVNTIALGSAANTQLVAEISARGGGRNWHAVSAKELPRLFLSEADLTFRQDSLEGHFPVQLRPHPITQGLSDPPELSVLLPAVAQPWAQTVIQSGELPVLVLGEYEGGRVGALTSDLSRSWQNWEQTPRLVGSLFRWLAASAARPRVLASRESNGVKVVVQGQFEQSPKLRYQGQEIALVPTGPLRYEALLPNSAQGEIPIESGGKPVLRLQLPGESEWGSPRRDQLASIFAATGGGVVDLRELPPAPRSQVNLGGWLALLALAIFLLERYLAYRKG